MASLLVDQWGKPLYSGGSGGLFNATRPDPKNGPVDPTRMESISQGVTYQDHKTLVSASRRLCANFTVLEGGIAMKGIHSIGRAWEPSFDGDQELENLRWADQAREWLTSEWYKVCDVRGGVFDFKTGLYLDSTAFDTDGDNGVILTESADGYPQIQRIASHRVGQLNYTNAGIVHENDAISVLPNGDGTFKITRTLYAGMRIEQGVIYNLSGAAVAVRVIGQYGGGEPQDISIRDCDFRFDPRFVDQGRGLPGTAGSIEFIRSCFTSHQYEQQALLLAGSIGLNEYNETGGADMSDPAVMNSLPAGSDGAEPFKYETFQGGMIRYWKAGSGNKVEAQPPSNRPGQAWSEFNDRIVRLACLGLGIPYSFVWKPESMSGTQERSAIELMRATIADRQDLLLPRAQRLLGYALAKAMKLGILDPYPGADRGGFMKWKFRMPPMFSIDHGRDDQAWLAMRSAGAATLRDHLDANNLGTVKNHYLLLANEDADRQEAIAEVERARNVKIDPRNIRMLTPNDQPQEDPNETENPQAAPPAPVAQPTEP